MTAAWGILLIVLLTGWSVLDGAVQGAAATNLGARGDAARRVRLAAVGPLLLPGEVWLVAGAGVLIGAFPHAEAELLHAGYAAAIALIASWALRDAALWLRSRREGHAWRATWDWLLAAASTLLPAAWGALLGTAWGSAVAVVVLAAWSVAATRLHGAALVARRLGEPSRFGWWTTSALVATPVLVTAVVAWPHLMTGTAVNGPSAALGGVVAALLPVLGIAQWFAWRLLARPLGPRDVIFF
ncbi:cytochrome d ubiquinol oxidase subunit II [Myceligenerans pegani]|uniref:Cytochrome d ubiquinol oxidase subunit II n=1 Tax=Myceligenerans pegani TaxID=2776917 RepID=A0ABR9N2F5_9MICO|nr:cytochrome d ubiquinol oxidase subunit II [Myceligenerans sp. TRM 65318]MBE1877813.1 cytochrome d ubiquinol oxidase subunit II [Myceligenerans sp. TRM 65318]MBE3020084.1 cytochrome d ubiquinol oxidase subunit II [Myceligenerans sp. TRM 65318]